MIKRLLLLTLLFSFPAFGAQFARPDSDVSGAWDTLSAGSTHWELIDDVTPVDSTNISEDDGSSVEVSLTNVTDPVSSVNHVVRCNAYRTSNKTNTLTIELFQGAVLKATNSGVSVTSGTPSLTYSIALSGAEADAISDYDDLRIVLTATATNPTDIFVTQCEFEVPNAPGGARRFMVN